MNKLDQFSIDRIRELTRLGYSVRKIARLTGVSRKTAFFYHHQFRHEAPVCRHSKNIYECAECSNYRRTVSTSRDIIWIKPGPKAKIIKNQSPTIPASRNGGEMLRDILGSMLVEKP